MNVSLKNNKGFVEIENRNVIEFAYKKNKKDFCIFNLSSSETDTELAFILLEQKLAEEENEKIIIRSPVNSLSLNSLLLNNAYIIENNENDVYIFEKDIKPKRSWRISLTENCNYDCFFCHGDGLDLTEKRQNKSVEELYSLIVHGIESGYSDITFTGGEPLIKINDIEYILEQLEIDSLTPDLTIVTNGYLITDNFLDKIDKYRGKFKFNFSMHAVDEENYLKITRPKLKNTKEVFKKIIENIDKIKSRNIYLKLNFVMLRNINNTKEYIESIVNFSLVHKVDTIKFLELLITGELPDMYQHYYKITGIVNILKNKIILIKKEIRKDIYVYKNSKMLIELSKCACELGCSKCILDRDISISSELKHYPCFLLSTKSIPVDNSNLVNVIKEGSGHLKKFAKKYGNGSPLITQSGKYIIKNKEYFYKTNNISFNEIQNMLIDLKYTIVRKRDFSEKYFLIEKKDNSIKVLKIFNNSYNLQEYIEVKQIIIPQKEKEYYNVVEFINNKDPEKIYNLDEYEKKLFFLNISVIRELNWKVVEFKKMGLFISIGLNQETGKLTIMSHEPISEQVKKEITLKNINMPLLEYLRLV